jgi:hypothetical protein
VYEQIDVVPTVAVGIRVASQEHAVVLPRIRHGAFSFHFVYQQQGIEDFLTPEGEKALRRHEVGALDFGISVVSDCRPHVLCQKTFRTTARPALAATPAASRP